MNISKPMKEVSVEEILEQYNLIVPEIQREYVWGLNQFGVLETFLKDISDGINSNPDSSIEIKSLEETIKNQMIDEVTKKNLVSLLKSIRKPVTGMNIGFLYSYKPGYYIGNDREEDLYLIDGQQRFTTLFLILFYFSLKEKRKNEFIELFKFNAATEKIAFDYRVRSITHQFIIELIAKSETVDDLLSVRQKRWFLATYSNDTTVKSIVGIDQNSGVFTLLNNFFKEDATEYYDFVRRDIKFWHFKTDETSQGEELYITMNSRGQQLADNETIRAKLFDDDQVRDNAIYWSEQWELWQDFFWKHRSHKKENISADEGFNEFLRWVQILYVWENVIKKNISLPEDNKKFEKLLQWEAGSQLDSNCLDLADIELSFKAIVHLFENFSKLQSKFITIYPKSNKYTLLSKNWISTEGNPLELINLFQLLPVILYCKKCLNSNNEINDHTLFRLMRMIKTLSKDVTIGKAVRNQITNVLHFADKLTPTEDVVCLLHKPGISKTILNDELSTKLQLIANSNERETLEDLIWLAEDLPYNNGEILHLVTITRSISNDKDSFDLDNFRNVIQAFDEFIKFEDDMTGNILHTDCYLDSFDRIEMRMDWYKRNGFLQLVMNRANSLDLKLPDFFTQQQKLFVKKYSSDVDIVSEASAAKQLYIYYILSTNYIIGDKIGWQWNGHYNFGKLHSESVFNIPFDKGSIFQFYRSAFRENESKILPIHRLYNSYMLKLLYDWALRK